MTHTVHIDRQGYVDTVFQNTRAATLDARKYPGTLMEVTGDVAPGWRWDGQRFALPPPRVPPSALRAERDRRIDGPFPERFRAQITALGGDNAVSVSNYVSSVFRAAEAFGDDAPQDFKDDRHWPKVPKLRDLQVPQRADVSPALGGPVTVNVAPVINTTQPEPKALVVQHEAVPVPARAAPDLDEHGLDRNDPLYPRKARMIAMIEQEVIPKAPADPAWNDALGHLAALHTASQSLSELEAREADIFDFLEGRT